jgi:hypothetical protein
MFKFICQAADAFELFIGLTPSSTSGPTVAKMDGTRR